MAENPKCEFYYSPEHLVDFCRFGERLRHFESGNWEINQIDADGNPDPSIILEPFEIWIESCCQGFRRRLNGTRLVETALELIPRKNAKSLRATRAALYELCCSGGLAPEIPIAAATAKQADDTLFGDIVKMVKNDPELVEEFKLRVTSDEITKGEGRIFKLSSQGERLDGLNPSLALFEEGHAGAASVYKVVDSAFGARPNAQRRMITTAGYRPEGPAFDLMKQAEMVLLGGMEDYTFFAAVYTLDVDDYQNRETRAIEWDRLLTNPELIAKANPMYGVSLDPIKINASVAQAFKLRPDKRGEVARTRFNIWTGAGTTLIEAAAWAACYQRGLYLSSFHGKKCWIGVDLAEVLDMCAISLMFELPNDTLAVFVQYYLPELSPTAELPDLVDNLSLWADENYLYLTEGPLADHDLVRSHVEQFCEMFDVQVIACDPRQAHNTVRHLWDGNLPVKVYPNNKDTMTPPTDDIIGRVATRRILHDGNPVLAWNIQNVYGDRTGNGQILPRKDKKDSPRKIDGFVATCFANGCRMNPDEAKPAAEEQAATADPYQHRGLIGFDQIDQTVGDNA
ncbi:terminase TerL endonuclease subunit [Shinella zoogloeoides]|uniref:terminase TerL endonuclease subunit n=1 Tax=Shinella zoogloeoides TaxID=352475 RepID=UPI00299D2DFE|nr:terminase TerL endonuclease subunit [Shinella zoogloeoides]